DLRSLSVEERVEQGLTLEKAGFETLQGWGADGEKVSKEWAEQKWKDQAWIETEYYSYLKRRVSRVYDPFQTLNLTTCRLLGKKFNATQIIVYDHTIPQ